MSERNPKVVDGLIPEIFVTKESPDGTVHEIEIAGVRFVREGTVPEGFELRWALMSEGGNLIEAIRGATRGEVEARTNYFFRSRAVRIYVETQQEGA